MKSDATTKIGWRAPSNIALVKYWGKKAGQFPENGSISMTLDKSSTTTWLTFSNKERAGQEVAFDYLFHGKRQVKFQEKVKGYLDVLQSELPFLTDYQLNFQSENNFPHSAGIASSASSMAALALCLVSMEEQVTGQKLISAEFFRRASILARLGSGSAARSVYGGLVSWGRIEAIENSSDHYATPFPLTENSRFSRLRDTILIVSSEEKNLSSTLGHASMVHHPYREARIVQADNHVNQLTRAIRENDFGTMAKIAENEALSLHALLLSSSPGVLLLKPNTLRIIEEIIKFRESARLDLFFTIDAGPNVHMVYGEEQREMILPFVQHSLSKYCEDGRWIDDKIGNGPIQLNLPHEN